MFAPDERRQDLTDNCNMLLVRLARAAQEAGSPAAHMIQELKRLKERAEAGPLALLVDRRYIGLIGYRNS